MGARTDRRRRNAERGSRCAQRRAGQQRPQSVGSCVDQVRWKVRRSADGSAQLTRCVGARSGSTRVGGVQLLQSMAVAAAEAAPVSMRHSLTSLLLAASILAPRVATAQGAARVNRVMAQWEEAVATAATSPTQWTMLGHALYDVRRYRESIAAFERALQLNADAPHDGARQIARAYAQLGNEKQTLRWLEHARQLGDSLFHDSESSFSSNSHIRRPRHVSVSQLRHCRRIGSAEHRPSISTSRSDRPANLAPRHGQLARAATCADTVRF